MIKDYYKILGVSYNASEETIKSSYRELALRHHPDRSRDTRAHDIFAEINEAYQVLSDPTKKADYDYRYRRYFLNEVPINKEHAGPQTEPPQNYTKEDIGKEEDFNENTYEFINRTAWAALVISLFLLIDFFLPHRVSQENLFSSNLILHYESFDNRKQQYITRHENYDIIRTENYYIFYKDPPYYMAYGDTLIIESSRIMDVPVNVFHKKDKILSEVPTQYGLYDLYFAYVVMFLTSLISVIIIKKKISAAQTLAFFWFVNLLILGWIFIVIFIYYNMK